MGARERDRERMGVRECGVVRERVRERENGHARKGHRERVREKNRRVREGQRV